jgi:predicted PurR-regulated permease PerM
MIRPRVLPTRSNVGTIGIVVAAIAILYLAREILIPLAFAITVTLILAPAVARLQKLRLGRFPSVLVVMTFALATSGAIGWVIFNELVQVVNDLPSYQQNIHNKIELMNAPIKGPFGRAADGVRAIGQQFAAEMAPIVPERPGNARGGTPGEASRPVPVQIVAQPANEFEYVADLARPVLAPLGMLGIVLIFSVFLLTEQNDLRSRLFRLAGVHQLNIMTQALDDATRRVSRYLMLQLLVNASFGILCGTGLYLIGVPYAVLWGAVAGILRIVPYAGSLVSASLPLLLSLAVFDGWLRPCLVLLLFATLELITGNFVEPWVYGMHTGISSLALLLTTVFWAALWGPAGLILATPLTVCVVVLGRHIPQLSFLHVLLGDQAGLSPEAHMYQRLLAMDDHEARAVADVFLGEHSLVELYDSVIVPALTMAEHDRHKGALDPTREEFVFLSFREMIAELSEKTATAELIETESSVEGGSGPKPPGGRILCLPASDEADEIAAAMLSQVLEQAGCAALSFPLDPAWQDVLAIVAPLPQDVFCVSSVPPFAFANARTLSRLLQVRFPRTRIVIGVWGSVGHAGRTLQSSQPAPSEQLVTNFANAIQYFVDSGPARPGDSTAVLTAIRSSDGEFSHPEEAERRAPTI